MSTAAAMQELIRRRPRAGGMLRDSVVVTLGGQLVRVLGVLTAFGLRRAVEPAQFGVYSGLKLYLDQANRSSLGVGQGAVQEIPFLLANGREAEAARVADVAYAFTTVTSVIYAVGLLVWALVRAPFLESDPQAAAWTWGLLAIALLVSLHRQVTFRIAILRAHRAFGPTTETEVLDALVGGPLMLGGAVIWGLPGLWVAIGVTLLLKRFYLGRRHPLRFRSVWDGPMVWELMRSGLPIFACTALFGAVVSVDRVLALWVIPDGARAVGLYSVALMGTSWAPDLAGRVGTVLYPHFQATLGRTREAGMVALQAAYSTEVLAAVLAAGSAAMCLVGPDLLGWLLPRYRDGLPALRPLLPGMLFLGLTWPSRQLLIALGRPARLALATLAGLVPLALAGWLGAARGGLPGLAWGVSFGQLLLYLSLSAAALAPVLRAREWTRHVALVLAVAGAPLAAAWAVAVLPVRLDSLSLLARAGGLVLSLVPAAVLVAVRCETTEARIRSDA